MIDFVKATSVDKLPKATLLAKKTVNLGKSRHLGSLLGEGLVTVFKGQEKCSFCISTITAWISC